MKAKKFVVVRGAEFFQVWNILNISVVITGSFFSTKLLARVADPGVAVGSGYSN